MASTRCSSCKHPQHAELNGRLLQGESITPAMAAQYGLSTAGIARHKREHLRETRKALAAVEEGKNLVTIVGMANDLYERALAVLDKAERLIDSDQRKGTGYRGIQAASASLREVRASIQLLASLVVDDGKSESDARNEWLDAAITDQLATVALPMLPHAPNLPALPPEVAVAELVDESGS